ncbi:hypothetical protein Hanom_Chr09g00856391 [Helianthus anomalus]
MIHSHHHRPQPSVTIRKSYITCGTNRPSTGKPHITTKSWVRRCAAQAGFLGLELLATFGGGWHV